MWSMPSGYGGRRYILQRLVYQLKINCLINISLTVISLRPNRHYTGYQEKTSFKKTFLLHKVMFKCVFQLKSVCNILMKLSKNSVYYVSYKTFINTLSLLLDIDDCVPNPCYPGVICTDRPAPHRNINHHYKKGYAVTD